MYHSLRRSISHSAFVLANVIVWGFVELVALNRARRPH
jgi:hypothetical protein